MFVLVAGAGALGSLLGGYLAQGGEQVSLLGRPALVDAVRSQGGLRISGIKGEHCVPVHAVTSLEGASAAHLVILGTKSQDSEAMLDIIEPIVSSETQILTPQNGVANEEFVIRRYGANRLLAAVTAINASMKAPGHVYHGAETHLDFREQGEQDARLATAVEAAFNHAGVVATRRADIMRLKWWKLCVFCVGSILNALTNVQSLAAEGELRELMLDLGREITDVVEAGRLTSFPIRPVVKEAIHFFDAYQPTNWRASVGQDLRRGKPTEVDYLNGYIVRLGRQFGVPTPVNHCIYTLVKTLEQTEYLRCEA